VSEQQDCAVIIVGGGPCGLVLAIELGRRGVPTIVLEEKTSPARFPAANATQARTMEYYRRLGFAHRLRAMGLPGDYPTDIAYFTRFSTYELARFKLPSAQAATDMVRTMTGSWSAAELPHRVSQMYVEDVLRAEAAAQKSVSVRYGWQGVGVGVSEDATGVAIEAERIDGGERRTFRAAYALGADGSRSPVRKALGLSFVGEGAAARDFMGGPMSSLYFRSAKVYDAIPHPRAWTYWTVNADRRACLFAINGRDEFLFHTQLRKGERHEDISDAEAPALFHRALGKPLGIEIISRAQWNAGYTLVADKFRRGRVFLGGDAAHLFTPTAVL
jgi:2-polyprenyl-6-methoxyphenol hydroxylase-like FAD-dependent oxidoreductase